MALRVGVDVGGTFTDLVAQGDEPGAFAHVKVPSVPSAPEDGVLAAVDRLLEHIDAGEIRGLAHSTTIATNALLGQMHLELARVVLLTTEGFRDVIEIGRQQRSELYDPNVTRPTSLVAREDRIAVRERMDYRGRPLVALERSAIDAAVEAVRSKGKPVSVAVSFLHSYANDAHEHALGDALREALPNAFVTLSCGIDPTYREYERTSTTVVNAALLPLVQGYLERLERGLRAKRISARLHVMQSSGGFATAAIAAMRPVTVLESGPASGAIAAAFVARSLGIDRVLSFDMGGTTAKAGAIVNGSAQIVGEFEAAGRTHSGRAVRGSGYPVRSPFVDLAEVSAGGGTIAFVDDAGALRVGPLSAGADPGPAAYGKSDVPTVTDANVVLGRLNPRALLGGAMPIDAERARAAVASLVPHMRGLDVDATAAGIVALIDDAMAKALRIVSIERGHDPRDFTLFAFGGGGPLHACALAQELGVKRVIVPPAPGMFSAFGLLVADHSHASVRSVLGADGTENLDAIEAAFTREETENRSALRSQGADDERIELVREIDARYRGQSFELTIPARAPYDGAAHAALVAAFHDRHERVYGFASRDEAVELVNVRSTAVSPVSDGLTFATEAKPARDGPEVALLEQRPVYVSGAGRVTAPVFERARLRFGHRIAGPAVIEQYDSCTYVPPGWSASVDAHLHLIVEHER